MNLRWSMAIAALLILSGAPGAQAQAVEASDEVTGLGVLRHDAGNSNNPGDDVFVLDVDDDDEISARDLVLATGGYANTVAGSIITTSNSALFGLGNEVEANVVYADLDGSGSYTAGDWVFLTGHDNELSSTKLTDDDDYSIRLTETDTGEAGTVMRTGDDDLGDWKDDVDDDLGGGSRDASFTWVDADGNDLLGADEDAYITPDSVSEGQAVPNLAILISYDEEPEEENTMPEASLDASSTSGAAPLTVNFTIDGSDDDGDVLTWTLDADGDGVDEASGSSLPATYEFTYDAGEYEAILTVTDGTDNTTATTPISVETPAEDGSDGADGMDGMDGLDGGDGGEPEEPTVPGLTAGLAILALAAVFVLRRH